MRFLPVLLIVLSLTAPAQAQSVWVASQTRKVRPNDPVGPTRAAALEAAQNEFEAFHVVVAGGEKGAAGVRVTASRLVGPKGAAIDGDDVRVFREAFIDVKTPSNIAGATGRWPDAMVPAVDEIAGEARNAFPVDVPAGGEQPVFIEYHVPASAPAGTYSGTVHVEGAGFAADVPVTLLVHGFALPSTASLPSAFGSDYADLCGAHFGGYAACGQDAGVERLRLMYARFALDHRITLDSVYTGPIATGNGYDWATWDAKYAPLFDGTAPTRLAGAKQTTIRYTWAPGLDKHREWANHLKQKGWFDRTFDYTCDEPPSGCGWAGLADAAALVHQADPDFRTLSTTTLDLAKKNGVADSVDILVPILNWIQPQGAPSLRATYDDWLAARPRRAVWTYQACPSHGCGIVGGAEYTGWPSYMIDAPATLNRAMEWSSFRERAQGELYYQTTLAFTKDAWTDQYNFGGNGDGTLFYPGRLDRIGGASHIPIASLRLKMIREGMEDYEYLKLLADAGDPQMAMAEATRLAPDASTFTTDPDAIDAARRRIAARIEALRGIAPPGSDQKGNSGANNPGANDNPSPGAVQKAGGCSVAGDQRGDLAGLLLPLALAWLIRRRAE